MVLVTVKSLLQASLIESITPELRSPWNLGMPEVSILDMSSTCTVCNKPTAAFACFILFRPREEAISSRIRAIRTANKQHLRLLCHPSFNDRPTAAPCPFWSGHTGRPYTNHRHGSPSQRCYCS